MRVKEGWAIVIVGIVLAAFSVYAASLSDLSAGDFSAGIFQSTFYNTSGFVQLNASQVTGNFTSRVFDALVPSTWHNMTWLLRVCPDCQLPDNRISESGYVHNVNMEGNVLLVHFNNTASENASLFKDFSGEGLNATCITNRCPAFSNNGKFGGAYDFENGGTFDDVVNFSNPSVLNNFQGQITLEAWLMPESFNNANNAPTFIDKDFARQYSYYFTRLSSTTARQRAWLVTSSGIRNVTGSATLSAGNWYHLVFTYNGSQMRVYANGVLDGTLAHNGLINSSTKDFLIGSGWSDTNPYAFPFDGIIDEVAIYNRSLSAEEVMDHYERGVTRVNMSVRACDDASCIGESFTDISDLSPQSFAFAQNRYFQYRGVFETDDGDNSPALYNVTLHYTANNTAPVIVLAHPLPQSYDRAGLNLNYSVSDAEGNIDACWYSLDNGATNISISCGMNVSLTAAEGVNSWSIYVNDSVGALNRSNVSFFVDSLVPLISFTGDSPANGSYLASNSLYINTSWTESNFGSISFALHNTTSLVNRTTFASPRTGINWTGLTSGTYFYNVTINDTLGNVNWTETRAVFIDTGIPLVSISYPLNTTYSVSPTVLNYSVSDINLQACWYSLDNGVTNATITCGTNVTGLSEGQGSHTWTIYANDSVGNTNSSRVTFSVDDNTPLISFVAPTEANGSNLTIGQILVNVTAFDTNLGTTVVRLYNTTSLVDMRSSSAGALFANFSGLRDGDYFFNATVNDTLGNMNRTETRRVTIDTTAPSVAIVSPENITYYSTAILVNISSNGASSVWFFNGTANETYSSPVTRIFAEGSTMLVAYAADGFGNMNSTSVTFNVDSVNNTAPFVTLNSPLVGEVFNANSSFVVDVSLNASIGDGDGNNLTVWMYGDNALLASFNLTSSASVSTVWSSVGVGNHSWHVIAFDGYVNGSASGSFIVNASGEAPRIAISSPLICSVFGTNESLSLSFVVNSSSLDTCWYSLDNGVTNHSVSNCQSTSFDVASSGDYVLDAYANESISGFVGHARTTFKVDIDAPTIIVESPSNGTHTNESPLTFNFFTEGYNGYDTQQCSLLGDFNGTYHLNQTNFSIVSGNSNSFELNLAEGRYNWGLRCGNAVKNTSMMCNYSVVSDVTPPNITFSEPNGTYVNGTVPIIVDVDDNLANMTSEGSCSYNVSLVSGAQVINATILAACASSVLNDLGDGEYQLILAATDGAGNTQGSSTIFAVSNPSPSGGPGGAGGGGGGDTPGLTGFARLNASVPNPYYIKRGQTGEFEVPVVNNGQRFLNQCYLRFSGEFARYLNASGESSFSSGQSYVYDVDISLSSGVVPGQYRVQGAVVCTDYSSQFTLNVVVTPTEFDFRMSNYTRSADLLLVRYSLEELVGRSQDLVINYALTNIDGDVVADGRFETSLDPNSLRNDVLEIVLPKDAFGEFNLQLDVDNGRESLGVERPIFLSSAGVTGLVISDENRRALTWFAVALFAIIIFILVVRYIYKHYQLAHYHPPRHMYNHHLHHKAHHQNHRNHRGHHHAS